MRAELARRCELSGEAEFGQEEKLGDRISGLLRDYNGPSVRLRHLNV